MAESPAEGVDHEVLVWDLPEDTTEEELQVVFATYGEVTRLQVWNPGKDGLRRARVCYDSAEAAEDAEEVLDGVYTLRPSVTRPIRVHRRGLKRPHAPKAKADDGAAAAAKRPSRGADAQSRAAAAEAAEASSRPAAAPPMTPSPPRRGTAGPPPEAGASGKEFILTEGGPALVYKLFVGNLPSNIAEEELRFIFGSYGPVMRVLINDYPNSWRLRSGFVFYGTREGAEDAIEVLNNVYKVRPDSRFPISVRWAGDPAAAKQQWKLWEAAATAGWDPPAWDDSGWQDDSRQDDGWQTADWSASWPRGQRRSWSDSWSDDAWGGGRAGVWESSGSRASGWEGSGWQGSGWEGGPDRGGSSWSGSGGKGRGKMGKKATADSPRPPQPAEQSAAPATAGAERPCPSPGCSFAVTWHATHCCPVCQSWPTQHGPRCDKRPLQGQAGPAEAGEQSWGGREEGGGDGWDSAEAQPGSVHVFANLPADIDGEALKSVFSTYGDVTKVTLQRDEANDGRAQAFVDFGTTWDAETSVMSLDGEYEIRRGFGPLRMKLVRSGHGSAPY